ncbi:hypothetical protein D9M71_289730 [compost metagenome]
MRVVDVGARQAVLAMQGGRLACFPRLFAEQGLINAWLFPVASLEQRAQHAQVDAAERLPGQRRQQGGRTLERQGRQGKANALHDSCLHQLERDRGGDVEDLPFMGQVVAAVAVGRIDADLLFATEYQNRRASDDQRPQRLEFRQGQRVDRVIGLNGREDAQRIAFGMVQQGRAGDREVSNAPGTHQVAEVDDALQLPLALLVPQPNGIVVGDI